MNSASELNQTPTCLVAQSSDLQLFTEMVLQSLRKKRLGAWLAMEKKAKWHVLNTQHSKTVCHKGQNRALVFHIRHSRTSLMTTLGGLCIAVTHISSVGFDGRAALGTTHQAKVDEGFVGCQGNFQTRVRLGKRSGQHAHPLSIGSQHPIFYVLQGVLVATNNVPYCVEKLKIQTTTLDLY